MRLLKIALLAGVLGVTFGRDDIPSPNWSNQHVAFTNLMAAGPLRISGRVDLVGAWQLRSSHPLFGNYSALIPLDASRLLAISDRNAMIEFARPDLPPSSLTLLRRPFPDQWQLDRQSTDIEAISFVPATGDYLIARENSRAVDAFRPDFSRFRSLAVPMLGEWPENQGPEAMQVLADGRLVMVGEVYAHWYDRRFHPAVVFRGLPGGREAPGRFELAMPEGFRPVDLAQLPDGRALVLGRKFTLAGFRSVILTFDPARVRPGAIVPTQEIARIDDPRVRDNYEGMTVMADPDGSVAIWLISDNNAFVRAQRTILLKLRLHI